jgi:hypothetical protein
MSREAAKGAKKNANPENGAAPARRDAASKWRPHPLRRSLQIPSTAVVEALFQDEVYRLTITAGLSEVASKRRLVHLHEREIAKACHQRNYRSCCSTSTNSRTSTTNSATSDAFSTRRRKQGGMGWWRTDRCNTSRIPTKRISPDEASPSQTVYTRLRLYWG